jgi:hypothetical protein
MVGAANTVRLQMAAIQRLMGALCFAKRAAMGKPNPYADLLAEDLWGNLGGWQPTSRLPATTTVTPTLSQPAVPPHVACCALVTKGLAFTVLPL